MSSAFSQLTFFSIDPTHESFPKPESITIIIVFAGGALSQAVQQNIIFCGISKRRLWSPLRGRNRGQRLAKEKDWNETGPVEAIIHACHNLKVAYRRKKWVRKRRRKKSSLLMAMTSPIALFPTMGLWILEVSQVLYTNREQKSWGVCRSCESTYYDIAAWMSLNFKVRHNNSIHRLGLAPTEWFNALVPTKRILMSSRDEKDRWIVCMRGFDTFLLIITTINFRPFVWRFGVHFFMIKATHSWRKSWP